MTKAEKDNTLGLSPHQRAVTYIAQHEPVLISDMSKALQEMGFDRDGAATELDYLMESTVVTVLYDKEDSTKRYLTITKPNKM